MTENLDNLPGIARRREEERKKLQESEHPTKSEYLLKICIIGTNFNLRRKLIRSSNGDHFDDQTHLTTGVDISTLKITVKNTPTKLILINSIDRINKQLRHNYYRGASACIIVFDKSDHPTFDVVPVWLEDFRKHIPSPDIPVALLGINTKEETVSTDEGKALAELLDLAYFETSSPKFENSYKVFQYLSEQVIK